jgi:aspartyl-tRNA(Asn)/glutamyl-tRNA(Gln) amidotransferase subunit A
VRFTDPIAVWLSAGALDLWMDIDRRAHWPARAADFTRYVHDSLAATADRPLPTVDTGKRRRQLLQDEMAELFEDIDVLLVPTTAVPAFPAGGPPPSEIDGREVGGAESVPFTMLANLCWNPACSVPAGHNSEGLPVGLQIVAPRFRDDLALRLARIHEQTSPWPRLAPPVTSSAAERSGLVLD